MQYVLTEQEYNHLKTLKIGRSNSEKAKLQEFCTMVANTLPVKFWGRSEATIWHCILTEENEHYCDECPSRSVCPHDNKQWSK